MKAPKPRIILTRSHNCWLAQFPKGTLSEFLGTDTVPTPFTPAAPAATVIDSIRELNPGYDVVSRAQTYGSWSEEYDKVYGEDREYSAQYSHAAGYPE